jgi:dTDP-4-amino-4,6-dideoxy-D-galactose acyltransferase
MSSFDRWPVSVDVLLAEFVPWSPHDYIRQPETFAERDRQLYAAHLTRALPPENDLRFTRAQDGIELAVMAERLAWDSAFFGYEIARLNGIFPLAAYDHDAEYGGALAALLHASRERGIRHLFAVVPAEDLAQMRALSTAGFALIETRLHYHREIADYEHGERYPVRLADAADLPDLRRSARESVNRYDRFHADPFVAKADADRMMEQWMEASVSEGFADGVIVPRDKPATAFCTIKFHRENWADWGYKLAQIPFGAVAGEWRGWYLKLMSEALYALKEGGAEHCCYVTQATNRATVRVLEKLGFRYGRSEHVFRLIL